MLEKKLRGLTLYEMIWYFFLYGCIGWVIEVLSVFIEYGKLSNRGILHIPHCPIYGYGILLVLLLVGHLHNRPVWLFVWIVLLTNTMELLTGEALLLLFNRRWWDYSNYPLDFHGFITLPTAIAWGIAGVIIIKYLHPKIKSLVEKIPQRTGKIILAVFYIIFLIDNVIVLTGLFASR